MHNIWSERFYGNRKPGWHGIGTVNDEEQSAVETLEMLGNYEVGSVPLYYMVGKKRVDSGYRAVLREPTDDDPEFRMFGAPVKDYHVFTPMMAAQMWDDKTGAPVETMGHLGKGEEIFITAKLPTMIVAGKDEVQNYLLFHNPMAAGTGAGAYVTSIRTECQNKLRAGIAIASAKYTITHNEGSYERMGEWLKTRWEMSQQAVPVLQAAYDSMVGLQVKEIQVKALAARLYPDTPQPDPMKPRKVSFEEALAGVKWRNDYAAAYRDQIVRLWDGEGTGLNHRYLKHSAYAAFNAVCELETYRRGPLQSVVRSVMTGPRGNTMLQAYDYIMAQWVGASTN